MTILENYIKGNAAVQVQVAKRRAVGMSQNWSKHHELCVVTLPTRYSIHTIWWGGEISRVLASFTLNCKPELLHHDRGAVPYLHVAEHKLCATSLRISSHCRSLMYSVTFSVISGITAFIAVIRVCVFVSTVPIWDFIFLFYIVTLRTKMQRSVSMVRYNYMHCRLRSKKMLTQLTLYQCSLHNVSGIQFLIKAV